MGTAASQLLLNVVIWEQAVGVSDFPMVQEEPEIWIVL